MWHNNYNNNNDDDDDDVSFDMRNALFVQTCSFSDIFVWHDCNVAPHHFGACVCVCVFKKVLLDFIQKDTFSPLLDFIQKGIYLFSYKKHKVFFI